MLYQISIIIIIIIMSCVVRLCGCLDAMLMGFHPGLAVERLREHWDDANTKVTHRKNQLDDMLLECRQFDEMSAEFDRWLIDVEDNFNDRPKSSQSIEALDKQIANHKVSYHLLSFMYCIGLRLVQARIHTSLHRCMCIDQSWKCIDSYQSASVNF